MSRLNGSACSVRKMPPSSLPASHSVTSWPRSAATYAATMPAMPPPTTSTRLLCAAGVKSMPSISRPMRGLTAQRLVCVTGRSAMHVKQRRHLTISSPRFAMTLLGISGSARSARPMTTMSATPDATTSSICAGSENAPTVATGTLTCFLISAARYALHPCSRNIEGWVTEKPNWYEPADTWMRSTRSSSACAIRQPSSRS